MSPARVAEATDRLNRLAMGIGATWTPAIRRESERMYMDWWLRATGPSQRPASPILWTRRGFAYGPFVRRRKKSQIDIVSVTWREAESSCV